MNMEDLILSLQSNNPPSYLSEDEFSRRIEFERKEDDISFFLRHTVL